MHVRKRPVEVEAVQLTWGTWNEVCDFLGEFPDGMRGVYLDENNEPADEFPGDRSDTEMVHIGLLIPTLEGTMLAVQGDWIIRGVKGELYPCKPDIFDATYETAPPDEASRAPSTDRSAMGSAAEPIAPDEIRRLRLDPGDRLIVRIADRHVSPEHLHHCRKSLQKFFPDNEVLVIVADEIAVQPRDATAVAAA